MNYETLDWLSRRFIVSESDIETLEERIVRYPWKKVLAKFDLPISRIRQSGSYVLSCPFHQERTPSFQIWVNGSGRYHCHGCGSDGTMIEFVVRLRDTYIWENVVRFFECPTFLPLSDIDPHQLWFPFVADFDPYLIYYGQPSSVEVPF